MAVVIRLSRQGAKKSPQFLVVAVDTSKKRDGAYLDKLGHYFPKAKDPKDKVKLNLDLLKSWQGKGAQVSETVGHLIKILAK